MTNNEFKNLVFKYKPNENKFKYVLVSFIVGGLIGLFGEVITRLFISFNIDRELATCYMIITFIFIASLLTALGIFGNLVRKARCGLIIPITGFAHSVAASFLDNKSEGFIMGMGSNAFKIAGSVIVYGTISGFLFGVLNLIGEVL